MSESTPIESPAENGLVEDMEMPDYRQVAAVSASDLKNMQRSPAYARMKARHSTPPTPAMEWGTAVHTGILEPDELEKRHPLDPEHPENGGYPRGWRNTKAYKEAKAGLLAEPQVESLLTAQQREDIDRIRNAVSRTKVGQHLHALEGAREASGFWHDDEFGVWRKVRPDWLIPSAGMVIDVKTSSDHRAGPFSRDCLKYGYHLSAAYYMDTLSQVLAEPIEFYVFLVVNSEAPFEVACYELDADSIAQGRHEYRRSLAEWRDCENSGQWPGGNETIEPIRIPEYGITYANETEETA